RQTRSTPCPYTTLFRSRALDHFGLLLGVVGGDDVGIGRALAVQQGHGADAVGAAGFGVENDFGQGRLLKAEGKVLFHLGGSRARSEEHTSELQSRENLV